MGLVKVAVAIALDDHRKESIQSFDIAAVTVLSNRIPDLFDYVCDENPMAIYTVKQLQGNQDVLEKVYGYFDRYGCFSGELDANTSKNSEELFGDLWIGLNNDDLIYLIEVHV